MVDIEESCLYLIDLAKKFNLDLEKILNHTTKNGQTLFHYASFYSERVTKRLLQEDVRVDTIDGLFQTASFIVRLKVDF